MKNFNLTTVITIFLISLTYSVGIDFLLIEYTDLINTQLSYFNSRGIGVILGSILFYSCIAFSLKINFLMLITKNAYNKNTAIYWKYRLLPPSILFGLTLSGYIYFISIPLMSLVSLELIYLFILHKDTNRLISEN
ncbi:hypothetical protein Sbal_2177 [Shewanella baltica OS155]|uniref:Uncharacterized protein n=1 Tax=Shewanella baltica (strain OS155 / ATCC BAA-1091) TaxID=325240 RepID=A3D4L0_SHEB5|nr:hypothetical protein Sbal_2177 [Shewanella baltica OS155]